MSQINRTSLASVTLSIVLLLSLFLLAACGDKNAQSDLDPVTGQHPANWLPTGHKTEAKAHMETCSPCHGADFGGWISKIACTECHLGNQLSVHPNQWGPFAYALHGSFVKVNDPTAATCANVARLCLRARLPASHTTDTPSAVSQPENLLKCCSPRISVGAMIAT